MTDYKALADRLESYIPQELGRAEEFGIDLAQAAAILRQLAAVDVEGVMGLIDAFDDKSADLAHPCSIEADRVAYHASRAALKIAIRALAVRVPDGWQLVPVEPTGEMLRAGVMEQHGAATYREVSRAGCDDLEAEQLANYAVMLAAAPQLKDQS